MRRRALITGAGAALGLAALPARAGTGLRIVAFGDSLTEGFGLAPREGMVPQLSDWLARQGQPARVVNAGLTGDTTYGGRVRLGWSLRNGADGVIVELGANDLLMRFALATIERNLDAILAQAAKGGRKVLLVGLNAPEWFIPGGGAQLGAMWQRLAARHGALLLPDLYAPLWRLSQGQARALLQEDGVHLARAGVLRVVDEALGPATLALIDRIRGG